MEEQITITIRDHALVLSGSLTAAGVKDLDAAVTPGAEIRKVDLQELDLEDSAAVAALVELIRRLAPRTRLLIVQGAPQALAHVLYRVGDLAAGSRIRLLDTRDDEPYG